MKRVIEKTGITWLAAFDSPEIPGNVNMLAWDNENRIYIIYRGMSEIISSKTIKDNVSGCHLWSGKLNTYGYGTISIRGNKKFVHRLSYELKFGEFDRNLLVLHKCDVRNCINPDHLFLGTDADNTTDKVSKNRHVRGEKINTAKLKESDIPTIFRLRSEGKSLRAIASIFKMDKSTIADILSKKIWKVVHEK